jgi:peptide/nickel transport system substrate-binding protein
LRKVIIPLVIVLICAFVITGCGGGTTTTTPPPTSSTSAATQPAVTTTAPATAAVTTSATKPAATSPSSTFSAATLAPTSTSQATNTAAKKGGIVRVIDPTAPGTPIGAPWETSGGSVLCMQLSLQFPLKEQLDGSLTPNLFTSYDMVTDPNNLSITFHLQKGVKFHDGTDFNAQAVKWCFEKQKASNMYASVTTYWKSLEVIDDYTLKINYTALFNRSTRSFADSVTYIVSPTAFEKNGIDWMRWHMVGTGPFIQKDFQRDVSLTTVRNPDYWEKGLPYLDGVTYLFVADEMTRVALFKSGGGEILNTNGNGRVAQEMAAAGYPIITQDGGANVLVPDSLNADSPWSNLKVRQAAEYAIDKDSIAKTFGYGYFKVASQINSSASPAYSKDLPGRNYDPAKAKALLTEAGYPNGFKTRIITANTSNMNIVASLQSYLGKVGIQCDIESAESSKYQAYTSGTWKNAVIFNPLMQWANPTVAFNFFFGTPTSWFQSLSKPDGWKDAVAAAATSPKLDPALCQKVEKMAYDDAMVIPLYFSTSMWAVTPNVQDSYLGTRGANTWWEPQLTWLSK